MKPSAVELATSRNVLTWSSSIATGLGSGFPGESTKFIGFDRISPRLAATLKILVSRT
jgi:hypothetical protein